MNRIALHAITPFLQSVEMDITLLGWIARGLVLLLLLLLGVWYRRGIQQTTDQPPRSRRNLFYLGLLFTALVLVSRLEQLVATYYTARAVQQLFLTEIIPFFIMAANPYPFLRSGVPEVVIGRFRFLKSHKKRLKQLTSPAIVWGAFVTTFWFWHDEALIRAVSDNNWLHVIEVASLLAISCLYWWHIAAALPHLHRPMSPFVRILYAFVGILPVKLTGLIMLFGQESRVGGYVTGANGRLMIELGNVQIADNSLGAIIIWVIGGVMYGITAIYLGNRLMGVEENKPLLPVNPIEDDELWIVPGIGPGREKYRGK